MPDHGRVVGFEVVAPPLTENERIISLAKQIRTREQLEAILADVQPEMQDAVRGMIETLVVFDDAPAAG